MRPAIVLCLLVIACGPAERPDPPAPMLDAPLRAASGRYELELVAEPAPPAVGQLFAMTAHLRADGQPVEGAVVEIRAAMPQHDHGMVTRPTHRELGAGSYRSEGLKLHMPGRWELVVRVDDDERAFVIPIEQPPLPVRRAR